MMITPHHRALRTHARVVRIILSIGACWASLACSDGADIIGEPALPSGSGGSAEAPPGEESANTETPSRPAPGKPPAGGSTGMPAATDTEGPPPVEEPDPPPPVAFVTPRGACLFAERVGRFSIEKQADFGVVQGSVYDGVVPTSIPRLELEQSGCRLFERRNLACSPACVGQETCGESGTCIPYPRQVSVGEVSITGLTQETRMSPQAPGNAYFAPGADNPPFAVQSEVILAAAGSGELGPFQLFGVGSEPLAEAPRWVLEPGADLLVGWAPPSTDVGTTVLVELTIDQHGTSPLSLACEFGDTGNAAVPAAIIDALIGAGVSGFPNGKLTRRTVDHVELGSGCVELAVGSPLAASIRVAGYTPCNATGDCPEGLACNVPLQRCE
jgi:hypothetical protein